MFAFLGSHDDPSDPDSEVDLIGSPLLFIGSLFDQGLEQDGFVGMAAWAQSAVVDTSITNFFASTSCF